MTQGNKCECGALASKACVFCEHPVCPKHAHVHIEGKQHQGRPAEGKRKKANRIVIMHKYDCMPKGRRQW